MTVLHHLTGQCEVLKGDACKTPAGYEDPHGLCVIVTSHKQRSAPFSLIHIYLL